MNSRINIVYVVSTLKKCGPTNQLFGIISNLDTDRFNPIVLTLFNEAPDSDISKFITNGINVESLGLVKKTNFFKTINTLKAYFSNKKTEVIHSTGLVADFCCSFIPYLVHISTIRNYAYYDYISAYGKYIGRIMILLNKWAIDRTDYPICCSKSIMLLYKNKIKKKMYYIRNGVDIEKYKTATNIEGISSQRHKLGLPVNKLIFIVSGSLTERKDPIFIIENFKSMNIADKACLLFIGDGNLFEECKKRESESIIVKGSVSDVPSFLNASDVYISASKSEGLPNSVLEASACGLEVVLSDIPQHKEIFENQKELAHFFELNNSSQFKSKINQMINKSKEQRTNPSEFILKNFSAESNSKKYSEFYEFVINKKHLMEETCE